MKKVTETKNLRIFAFGVLVYNIFVVVFGGFVRATGSGAGCGSHWPLCNGVVVPRAAQIETVIEYTHRITSGLTIVLIFLLAYFIFRRFASGHPARKAAVLSVVMIIVEALIGAGLVLFDLVVYNASAARVAAMMAHLVSTLILLGSLTWLLWLIRPEPLVIGNPRRNLVLLASAGLALIASLAATGAIAALGNSIFPETNLVEGLRRDFDDTAHILIRLRVIHPILAVGSALYLVWSIKFLHGDMPVRFERRLRRALYCLIAVQLLAGLANIWLLAPTWLQLTHLFLSTMIWVTYCSSTIFLWIAANFAAGVGQEDVDQRVHESAAQ